MTWEYTTPHKPQMNRVIERIFSVIKEGALVILLNMKLDVAAQIILWAESVCTCQRVRNIISATGSTTSPFENIFG